MKKTGRTLSKLVMFIMILAMLLPSFSSLAIEPMITEISALLLPNNGCTVEGYYLYGVGEKTTKEEFLSYFDSTNITVWSRNEYIGTGSIIHLMSGIEVLDELLVVVKGDLDGDGEIKAADYLRIKRAFLGTYTLTKEATYAACVSGTASPTARDYLQVKRHILGTYNLFGSGTLNFNGTKIAYVPIDDRPVNVDRVIYQADSAGFELLMPAKDLYATKLDGNGTNANGTKYGDPEKLMEWIQSVDAECDYFIISLDQMLSGGLVNSRVQNNTDLSNEYKIIDFLIELDQNNTVYFFDTVMRLASTVDYNGYGYDEYTILRNYGAQARATLSGANLTIDKIIAGYKNNTAGQAIACSLTPEEVNAYLAARARKLKLTDYFLTNGGTEIEYCYIGVDDSSPSVTIQTNEIAYIRTKILDNGILFAGCDEIGMMCFARFTAEIYRQNLKVAVTYFGGNENSAADSYDIGTLKKTVEDHLTSIKAVITTADQASMEVLVLTKPLNLTVTAYSNLLLDRLEENIAKKIPTVVIDASTNLGTLQPLMTNREIPLSTLVGYSNWNTVSNAVGIAVSQGITRVAYLKGSKVITDESAVGFLKGMTFAYIKDINFKTGSVSKTNLLVLINGSEVIISLSAYKTELPGKVSISSYTYPWNRGFEATFTIFVKEI